MLKSSASPATDLSGGPKNSSVEPLHFNASRASTRADLKALTGVRFVAASYVVLYHSKLTDILAKRGHSYLAEFASHGMFAVQLFFLLSGFILAYTYNSKLSDALALRKFWEARFARVWPLYFLSLISSSFANHTTPHILPAAATLVMVQSWSPFGIGAGGYWNFVCWTLSCEAFFYALFPFVQRRLQRAGLRTCWVVLAICVSIAAVFCIGRISFASADVRRGIPLALIRLPDFLAGVCLGNLFLRRARTIRNFPWLTWIGCGGSIWCLSHVQRYDLSAVVIFVAALLYGLASEESMLRQLLSTKVLLIGGAASYAMYLFQWPVKAVVAHTCDHFHVLKSPNSRFVLYCFVLLTVSCALYYAVEEPAREAIRKSFGMKRPRPLAP